MKSLPAMLVLAVFCVAATSHAANAPLPAFTAHYAVSKDGSRIGHATLKLQRDGADWVYTTTIKGTAGMASLLGMRIDETSRFRWDGQLPQMRSYDYEFDATLKHRARKVRVVGDRVNVTSAGHHYEYASTPGMVERHSTVLALATALVAGKHDITLSVATRKQMRQQHYAVSGQQTLTLPAGKFVDATHVKRTDHDRGISAWFATDRCPAPIKLAIDGKDTELKLLDCRTE